MNFEASRAKALDKLNYFVENNLSEYSKLRNFDFGPENRSNISCLSPYITHGVIGEKEVIEKALGKFSFSKNEKFIQEVLWRTYWKGWLELRPNVWSEYLIELNKIREDYKNNQDYINALEGKTNIECFNTWVNCGVEFWVNKLARHSIHLFNQKTTTQIANKPRNRETKKPRNQEAHIPRKEQPQKQRNRRNRKPKKQKEK